MIGRGIAAAVALSLLGSGLRPFQRLLPADLRSRALGGGGASPACVARLRSRVRAATRARRPSAGTVQNLSHTTNTEATHMDSMIR